MRVSLTREVSDSDTDASFMTRLAPEISVYTVDPTCVSRLPGA